MLPPMVICTMSSGVPATRKSLFDADGSVVMGKTVMCPCNGLYSGYKKGFDEDIRDIKRAAKTQLNKLNYFKYYIGMDYNIASPSAASDHLSIDDIRFANGPIKLKTDNLIDDQDNLSFVSRCPGQQVLGTGGFL